MVKVSLKSPVEGPAGPASDTSVYARGSRKVRSLARGIAKRKAQGKLNSETFPKPWKDVFSTF